jgi:DNA-binding NtrC family response regulator
MEGVALFNLLKAQNHDVRIVLMTGYPLDEDETILLEQKVVGWFQKPVSLSDLSQIVSKALLYDNKSQHIERIASDE